MSSLVDITGLKTHFFTFRGVVRAVDGISFTINEGESVGLVGESGSGKTVTGFSILKLVPLPGKIIEGDIKFHGQSILNISEDRMREIRGRKISTIFQNPRTALNPLMNVGDQIDRVFMFHTGTSKNDAKRRRLEVLESISISEPERTCLRYPHQLSGGMCQRMFIAMALMCSPELIIADEPTTGLDVTVQKQILELLKEQRKKNGSAQILITHDLGIVAETCERVVVLYAGKIMEIASTLDLYATPNHPYTKALLKSISRLDAEKEPEVLPGMVPNPLDRPQGCPFHPRCPQSMEVCSSVEPLIKTLDADRQVACHLF